MLSSQCGTRLPLLLGGSLFNQLLLEWINKSGNSGFQVDAGGRRASPFPFNPIFQNGPRRQGSASPRKTGAPLTAQGRSEHWT
jgi:hypothetical protein